VECQTAHSEPPPCQVPELLAGLPPLIPQVGLGVIRPGQLALLTGSSHLHLGVTDKV